MAHPLYSQCLGCLNKPVTLHLTNGQSRYGVLQQVTPSGVYLMPTGTPISAASNMKFKITTADNKEQQEADATEVFFTPFFFPFGILAGFTLGFAVGALARPRFFW